MKKESKSKGGRKRKSVDRFKDYRLTGKAMPGHTAASYAMADPDTSPFEETEELTELDIASLDEEADFGIDEQTFDADVIAEDDNVLLEDQGQSDYPQKKKSQGYLLQSYFRDMGKIPLLSVEETMELFKQLDQARKQQNSYEAAKIKEKLVSANLRLVVSLAKGFSSCGIPLIDLIQAGNMGLMRSVDGFNYRLGFKFSTYASKWIFASITRMVSNQSRTVRIPVNVIPALKKVRQVEARRAKNSGETAPDAADETTLPSPKKQREMARILQFPISLDQSLDDATGCTVLDTMSGDNDGSSIAYNADLNLLREQIQEIITDLDSREQRVIKLRFGLEDGIERTQLEVAHIMQFSRQRVSQIEKRALLRLRASGGMQKLRTFIN